MTTPVEVGRKPVGASRNRALDGIRGIAVLLVVESHANNPLFRFGGIAGVTLFFVLSGYLITSLLASEKSKSGTISLRRFYFRRAMRLLPALTVAVVGGSILALTFGAPARSTLTAASMSLLYIGNLWPLFHIPMEPFGQLWSLSLEEQYYVLWPLLLLLLLGRMRTRIVVGLIGTLTLTSVILRFVGPITTPQGYDYAYYLPQSNLWAILLGSLLALLLRSRPQLRPPQWTWTIGLIGLLLVATVMGMRTGLHEEASATTRVVRLAAGPAASIFSAILVTHCAAGRSPRWLVNRLLIFFGGISYALYLWHDTIDHVLGSTFGSTGLRGLVVGHASALLAIGVAAASGRWVEAPFLRQKTRLEQRWKHQTDVVCTANTATREGGLPHTLPALRREPGSGGDSGMTRLGWDEVS